MSTKKFFNNRGGALVFIVGIIFAFAVAFLLNKMNLYPAKAVAGMGMDALNTHQVQQGLFDIHKNNCSNNEAFVMVADEKGYCIEKTERKAASWEKARQACAAVDKRLPEAYEWKIVCKDEATHGINDMTGNWEWTSNFAQPMGLDQLQGVGTTVYGWNGCGQGTWEWVGLFTDAASDPSYEKLHEYRCLR